MLGALASGRSRIRGVLESHDVASTAAALRALGVSIAPLAGEVEVQGRGLRGLLAAGSPVDCGNSGTTTRLLAGIAAAHPFATTFIGDDSLSRRPMRRVAEPLEAMGARVEVSDHDGLPMTVHGAALRSVGWTTGTASAQVKSAILLAATVAQVPVTVTEPLRSRDHTERMLAALGADVVVDGTTVTLGAARELAPVEITVPGDPSSAAFFVALAAMSSGKEVHLPGIALNPTRTGFLDVVERMGARIAREVIELRCGEPVGSIIAGAGTLRGVTVGAAELPGLVDEVPILAALATRAAGDTVVTGAAELRVKESDRIAAMVANLRAVGARAEELPDGMRVTGSDRPLRGAVRTFGDHRLAMAFGILGAIPGNEITLDDPACVAVSFPAFWEELARVRP